MPLPRFEVPLGAVNGVNKTYFTLVPYKPGTTAYFLNGQLKRADLDDGWVETDPATGEITVNEAPLATGPCPDVVQFFYLDTSEALDVEEVCPLRGKLFAVDGIKGSLMVEDPLAGVVHVEASIKGALLDPERVAAVIVDEEQIRGVIAEVC